MLGRVIEEKAETGRARKTLSSRLSEDSLHSSPPNCAAIRILRIPTLKTSKPQLFARSTRQLHSVTHRLRVNWNSLRLQFIRWLNVKRASLAGDPELRNYRAICRAENELRVTKLWSAVALWNSNFDHETAAHDRWRKKVEPQAIDSNSRSRSTSLLQFIKSKIAAFWSFCIISARARLMDGKVLVAHSRV